MEALQILVAFISGVVFGFFAVRELVERRHLKKLAEFSEKFTQVSLALQQLEKKHQQKIKDLEEQYKKGTTK